MLPAVAGQAETGAESRKSSRDSLEVLLPLPHTDINKIKQSRRKGSPDSQYRSWIPFGELVVTSHSHVAYHCSQLDPFPEFFFVWLKCRLLPTRGRSSAASWGSSALLAAWGLLHAFGCPPRCQRGWAALRQAAAQGDGCRDAGCLPSG